MVLRQFGFDGREIKAALPRSSFPRGKVRSIPPAAAGARFEVGADAIHMIGLINYQDGRCLEDLIDVGLDGSLRDRLRLPCDLAQEPFAFAVTVDGHAYLQSHGVNPERIDRRLYTPDWSSREWKAIPNQGDLLVGADGDELVYQRSFPGPYAAWPIELQWFKQP
jgi:hypothetical protein